MRIGHLSIILLILLLGSCSYRVSVPVDTLEPPTVYYMSPRLNTTVNFTYSESNRLTDPEQVLVSKLDSIASEAAAYALRDGLATPAVGSRANVVTSHLVKSDSSISSTFILPKDSLDKIIESTNSQQVISLDFFALNPDITVLPDFQNEYGYHAFFTINALGIWRIYGPDSQTVQAEHIFKKAYSWDAFGTSRREAIDNLPKFVDVASYVGGDVGINSLSAFTPQWTTQYRKIISCNNSYMKMAENDVSEGNWTKAIKIWSWMVGEKGRNNLKNKAAYNLAVASEVNGDYSLAVSWLNVADSLGPKKLYITEYRTVLNDRLKAKKLLDSLK